MAPVGCLISSATMLLVIGLVVLVVVIEVRVDVVAAFSFQASRRRISRRRIPWSGILTVPTLQGPLVVTLSSFSTSSETAETSTGSTSNITDNTFSSTGSSEPSVPPTYGLYEVQEEMLVRRGVYEEQLMSHTKSTPLLHIEPPQTTQQQSKRSTSSGTETKGFGTSSSSSKTKSRPTTTLSSSSSDTSIAAAVAAQHYASILRADGLVRIDNVIPTTIVDELKEFVMKLRVESAIRVQQQQQSKSVESFFADVLLRKKRCDLKIPLGDNQTISTPVIPALYNVLCCSPVSGTIADMFPGTDTTKTATSTSSRRNTKKKSITETNSIVNTGTDAVLYELSCLISDYGSDRQVVHPDNPFRRDGSSTNVASSAEPTLITCFIALQDITNIDMGPTIFLPKTHCQSAHESFAQDDATITSASATTSSSLSSITNNETKTAMNQQQVSTPLSPKDILLRDTPSVIGTLTKGSCVLYDSRLLHCGSANRMIDTNRAIFYFSFRNPRISYPGNPPSIRTDLQQQQISLSDLQNFVTKIYTRNVPNPFHY